MVRFIQENGEAKMVSQKELDLPTAQAIHRNKKLVDFFMKDIHGEHKLQKCDRVHLYSEIAIQLPEVSIAEMNNISASLDHDHNKMIERILATDNYSKCANYETNEEESTDKEPAVVVIIPSALVLDILKNLDKDEEESETDTNIEVS